MAQLGARGQGLGARDTIETARDSGRLVEIQRRYARDTGDWRQLEISRDTVEIR